MPRNVVLMPMGSHGDVHPFVGVGLELRRRGHTVSAWSSSYYAGLLDGVGIPYVDALPAAEFRALLDDPRLWEAGPRSLAVIADGAVRYARSQIEHLDALAGDPDLLVIAGPLALGARVAQERHGLRLATLQLSPSGLPSADRPPRLPGLFLRSGAPAWFNRAQLRLVNLVADRLFGGINEVRREVGLGPVRGIVEGWWNSPTLTLALFPEWFAPRPRDWPDSVEMCAFPLYDERGVSEIDAEATAFLEACAADGGPVAFTPGSAMVNGHDFFAAAAEACERLGRPGVLLTRHAAQIPATLPDRVRHFAYLPFSELLPRAAALVHHGGVGTMSQAFAAGVPQLVMPMAHDQFDNAERVRRLGVGDAIDRRRFDGRRAAEALRTLLDDPVLPARCAEVKALTARDDGIALACDRIEAMS